MTKTDSIGLIIVLASLFTLFAISLSVSDAKMRLYGAKVDKCADIAQTASIEQEDYAGFMLACFK